MKRAIRRCGMDVLVLTLLAAWLITPPTAAENSQGAAALIKSGSDKLWAMDFAGARTDLRQAVEMDPGNAYAKALLERAVDLQTAQGTGGTDEIRRLLDEAEVKNKIRLEMARLEMEHYYAEGKTLIAERKYQAGIESLKRADAILTWLEPQMDLRGLPRAVRSGLSKAEADYASHRSRLARQREDAAQREADKIRAEAENAESRQKQLLLARGRGQFKAGNYRQAAQYAQGVLAIDPEDGAARRMLDRSLHHARVDRAQALRSTKTRNDQATTLELGEMSIPQTQLIVYPDNWETIRTRTSGAAISIEEEGDEAWKEAIQNAMKQKVTFSFADTQIDAVLRFLQELTQITFVLDPDAVSGKESQRVSLSMNNTTLESALNYITNYLGLAYTLKDEAVWITTPDKAKGAPVLKLYDVSDLIFDINDFHISSDTITLKEEEEGGGIFGNEDDENERFTGESLVQFIKDTIATDTWGVVEYRR